MNMLALVMGYTLSRDQIGWATIPPAVIEMYKRIMVIETLLINALAMQPFIARDMIDRLGRIEATLMIQQPPIEKGWSN